MTKTFTAKKCSISLLMSKQSKSSYSVDAQASGVNVAPSIEWWNSQRDEDWRDLSHVSCPLLIRNLGFCQSLNACLRRFTPLLQIDELSLTHCVERWGGNVHVRYLVETSFP